MIPRAYRAILVQHCVCQAAALLCKSHRFNLNARPSMKEPIEEYVTKIRWLDDFLWELRRRVLTSQVVVRGQATLQPAGRPSVGLSSTEIET